MNDIAKNTVWKFAERVAAQGIAFIVSLVLARLVSPSEYGVIALVNIFITISTVFVTFGINSALIQKKDADEWDFSTALYLNILIGILLYISLYALSPTIACFYENDELVLLIRILAASIPIYSINSVQQAFVAKTMQFKLFFEATLIGSILSAFVGILMAVANYGVWALVCQTMTNLIVDTMILGLTLKWRPKFKFNKNRAKHLFKYGMEVLIAQLINSLYSELRGLFIGKIYNSEKLSYYNKGKQIPMLIETNFDLSIASVIFVSFSFEQDNIEKFNLLYGKALKVSTYISFPVLLGMYVVANNIISVLYSEKWIQCVPYMKIMCIAFLFYGIDSISIVAMRAIGKSKEGIVIEIIHKAIMLIIILLSVRIGVYALVATEIVANIFHLILVMTVMRKNIGYGISNLINDCAVNLITSICMVILVFLCSLIISDKLVCLLVQTVVGLLAYLLLSIMTNNAAFYILLKEIHL